MPRLPLAEPRDGADPAPLKLFRMVAHAESAYAPWLQYGGTLLTRLELDPLLRELAILQVAQLVGSRYEWVQHDPIAVAVGATRAQIDAIEAGRDDDPAFDADQSLVLRATRGAVDAGRRVRGRRRGARPHAGHAPGGRAAARDRPLRRDRDPDREHRPRARPAARSDQLDAARDES